MVDFDVIWRYFGWANQTMACVTLWAVAIYLVREHRLHWIATLPAVFMTAVCVSYLCNAKIGFGLSLQVSSVIAVLVSLLCLAAFLRMAPRGQQAVMQTS